MAERIQNMGKIEAGVDIDSFIADKYGIPKNEISVERIGAKTIYRLPKTNYNEGEHYTPLPTDQHVTAFFDQEFINQAFPPPDPGQKDVYIDGMRFTVMKGNVNGPHGEFYSWFLSPFS